MESKQAAERLENVTFSGIRDVFETVSRLEREGKDIVHMEIGRPDFDTPEPIKQAAIKALNQGFVYYTSSSGITELREAIARKLAQDNDISVSLNGLVVTAGASEAIFCSIMTFLNPGDEVIIPEPMYVYYKDWTEFAGATTVSVPLREETGYQPDPAEIKGLINDRTRMLVLNYPHNPTGVVLDRRILDKIAELVMKEDLLVLSDEIYERITYGGVEHVSPASLPGMEDRTLTVNGFSKSYSMTGWRLGYVAGAEELIQPLLKTRQHTSNCPCSFGQKGAVIALRDCQSHLESMVQEFDRRRALVIDALNQITGLELVKPMGAFYAFPSIKGFDLDSYQMAEYLLEEANVAVVPGAEFGKTGEGHIRIAYSTGYRQLEKGLRSINKALEEL